MENKPEKQHQKHTKLTSAGYGVFARQEWAILGAPCGLIQQLAKALSTDLASSYRVAYVDADHSTTDTKDTGAVVPNHLVYTDKIDFHRFDLHRNLNSFQYRQWFNDQDLVLVNGNHFQADRQLVIIDPRKFESLQGKLDRLSRVTGFVRTSAEQEIPSFLREHLPYWQELPVWSLDKPEAIAGYFRRELQAGVAPINGLVLAGGRSIRMGQDKGLLSYHGLPQREHLYRLMEKLGMQPFLSGRPDQMEQMPEGFAFLPDSFLDLGPYGAILSAFRQAPDRAWLVVACDLPFVDESALQHLIRQRDPSAVATAYHNAATGFPDPLLTLWEPKAYPIMLQFLAQSYSCPRKVLINSDIHQVQPPNEHVLANVNNPTDLEKAKNRLSQLN